MQNQYDQEKQFLKISEYMTWHQLNKRFSHVYHKPLDVFYKKGCKDMYNIFIREEKIRNNFCDKVERKKRFAIIRFDGNFFSYF